MSPPRPSPSFLPEFASIDAALESTAFWTAIVVAFIGFGGVIYNQWAQRRATRQDKLRDAYLAWFDARVRLMIATGNTFDWLEVGRADEIEGRAPGESFGLSKSEWTAEMASRSEIESAAKSEEEAGYARLALLDPNRGRLCHVFEIRKTADRAMSKPGSVPTRQEWDAAYGAVAEKVSALAPALGLSLELEQHFMWTFREERIKNDLDEVSETMYRIMARVIETPLGPKD